ncbi:MAG: hypothetical protein LBM66_00925 [Bifidobacteriaceae bacterium]|nr:hypothetical protein [Bifidobacteriaceae bacterium]
MRLPPIVVPAGPDAARPDPAEPVCSARGCHAAPSWALKWNNPKLHAPDYRKVWLACDAHVDDLEGFLSWERGFLVEREPFTAPGAADRQTH